jgi:hypothetical protein
MAYETGGVRGTRTWYGPRTREYSAVHEMKKNGKEKEITIAYDQNSLDVLGNNPLIGKIPAGAKPTKVLVYVEEAAGDGTAPTIELGTSAGGAEIVAAPIDAAGTFDGTEGAAVGAIASADLSLYVSFAGTAAATIVGKGKIVVQYDYISY